MKISRITGLIIVAVAGVVLVGGWLARTPSRERRPPASVPKDAVWVGFEKGEWIHCVAVQAQANLFSCSVYDLPGNKLSAGHYFRRGERRNQFPKYVGYDLTSIEIEGGKLIPVGKHIEISNCHRVFPDNAKDFREDADYPMICGEDP